MKKITILVAGAFLVGSLGLPVLGLAQDVKNDTKADVKISTPILLPTSPFYFIKEFGRAVQTFLTFNAEKKAELKLRIADEKLTEAKIVSEKQPQNQKGLENALQNYEEQRSELKTRLEKLTETSKNPNVSELVKKIDEKIIAHSELFNSLIIKSGKELKTTDMIKRVSFTGKLEAAGVNIQMWGTHKLTVEEKNCLNSGDSKSMAPCAPPIQKIYLVKAANDKVLAELKKYEGQKVTIKGTAAYMNLEGGFWGIVAEEVLVPGVSGCTKEAKVCPDGSTVGRVPPKCDFSPCVASESKIKIISPVAGDKWVIRETYRIKLNQPFPGEDTYCASSINLLDSSGNFIGYLSSAFKKGGTSLAWKIDGLDIAPCGTSATPPAPIEPGKYKLKVNIGKDGKFIDEIQSDIFEIVSSGQFSTGCVDLDNWGFRSVNQYQDVLRLVPEPAGWAYRSVSFYNGKFGAGYADVVENGTYKCKGNVFEVKFYNRIETGSYDPDREILTWRGVEYRKDKKF